MQIETNELIDSLLDIVGRAKNSAFKFRQFRTDQLNYKPAPEEWSILECLEHLNLYGDYYLPEIEKSIRSQPFHADHAIFHSGFIGNYFATLMQVKDGKIKRKLQSPKDKNPLNSKLTVATIDRFLTQADKLDELLNQSREINLTRIKTGISLSGLIKLRLGDTFRFFVFHIERHVVQAERIELKMNRKVLV